MYSGMFCTPNVFYLSLHVREHKLVQHEPSRVYLFVHFVGLGAIIN